MAKSVFCLIDNESQAATIVDELRAGGFSNNDISVLSRISQERETLPTNSTPKRLKVPPPEQVLEEL